MKKIILFGGTFDPPHNGHLALLRAAVSAVQPDEVVVMPTGTPPHKQAHAVDAAARFAMCECFLPLFANTRVSSWEIEKGGKSYTVDTLRALHKAQPAAQLFLPMGSDMLLYFEKWVCWQEILRLATLVVQCRQGQDAAPVQAEAQRLRRAGGTVLFTQGTVVPLSSTEVRAAIAAGAPYTALVPPAVADYIAAHKLYQQTGGSVQ